MYPPTVLEAINQKAYHWVKIQVSSGRHPPEAPEENPFLAPGVSFWWLQVFLGLWLHHCRSCFFVTFPLLFCV